MIDGENEDFGRRFNQQRFIRNYSVTLGGLMAGGQAWHSRTRAWGMGFVALRAGAGLTAIAPAGAHAAPGRLRLE